MSRKATIPMDVVYAKGPIRIVDNNGTAVRHPAGSHWPADDPYVRAHPNEFSDDPRYYLSYSEPRDWYLDPDLSEPVETATSVPGERRNVRRG